MALPVLTTMLATLFFSRAVAYSVKAQLVSGRVVASQMSQISRCMATEGNDHQTSVSGTIYSASEGAPVVTLFTKDGCTLCDKVKNVLSSLKSELPHSLEAVDITDEEHVVWFSKYKYDIPVLHIENKFWIKHRLDESEAREGLQQSIQGKFVAREGEPDAGEMERRQAEREGRKE